MSMVEITPNEIDLVSAIIRGILKDPDAVDDSNFENILQILEMIGSASVYAHYPITVDTRNSYMDTLSAVLNKLFHSYKVKRAYPNVVELEISQSISA